MIGRWTKKIIDFLCVGKVSNYTLALIFGILFSLIGPIATYLEFKRVVSVDISGSNPLESFEPLLNKFKFVAIILLFFIYFFWIVFVFLLNIYIFFWFGVNFGNLIGWVGLKVIFRKKEEKQ